MNVVNSVLWRMAIILKTNKINLFVSCVLFIFWYHSPNFLDTPRIFSFPLHLMLPLNLHIVSQSLTNRLLPKDEVNETVGLYTQFVTSVNREKTWQRERCLCEITWWYQTAKRNISESGLRGKVCLKRQHVRAKNSV
jgi:hypothetical protein